METPRTLLEAVTYFADPDRAHEFAVRLRWPNGVACPRMGCGSADVQYIKTRKTWRCKECKRQFTAKVGTIYEDSPIPFTKWLPAIWLLSSERNEISSCELGRALGVTQKTAWFILHRIRAAMQTPTYEQFSGSVEIDETYIGGEEKNKRHPSKARRTDGGRGPMSGKGPKTGRTIVMGFKVRGGEVREFVVPENSRRVLMPRIVEHVGPGATIYTDALGANRSLTKSYVHHVINHAVSYVEGHVHTNSIENFWSVLKRTLGGTYICARPEQLDAYLNEQIFRFNERDATDGPRFAKAAKAQMASVSHTSGWSGRSRCAYAAPFFFRFPIGRLSLADSTT